MLRHSNMHNASAVVGEEHQNEQQPACRCRDDEKVGCDELLHVVRQEGAPRLRGWDLSADHVFRDGCLRDREAKLEQLPVNARRTPERIGRRHHVDQRANLLRDGRPTHAMAALPRPEEAESAPMPRNDRFRLDDYERGPPLVPGS